MPPLAAGDAQAEQRARRRGGSFRRADPDAGHNSLLELVEDISEKEKTADANWRKR